MPDVAQRRAALIAQRRAFDAEWERVDGHEDEVFGWHQKILIPLLRAGLKATGLWARGRRNACRPHLLDVTWHHPRLPSALEGLRILHLGDMHYRRNDPEYTDWTEKLVAGIEVDLCLMTGDYRFGHLGPWDHVPRHLAGLLRGITARHGIYATLGNHDSTVLIPSLEALGVRVLLNEGTRIHINGAPIFIGGTDDSHILRCGDIEVACEGATKDDFVIALSHTPELVEEAVRQGVHVYLCGHTHGGQIRLPWWGPVEINARCPTKYHHGEWREGDLFGLTSAGLGTTDLPVRYNCPGEAHVITLRGDR